ncbi:peptide chain release factor N(5)-glutamine methyltransferase [Burkholderiales bacterium]|nr:peptide chain release factor N(5)-glutamine methyltransferase [Burkholderiales bacterium]
MKIDSLESDINDLTQMLGISRPEAIREMKILFGYANNLDPVDLIKEPGVMRDPIRLKKYRRIFHDRLMGKPVAYILGYKEFYGLCFNVNEHTLIPRPDTELLVDLAIEKIQRHNLKNVLELGTGSGSIAISIATHLPNIQITATDISSNALGVALGNAENLCPNHKIEFKKSDWFSEISEAFDLIVSNPPYIATDDAYLTGDGVIYEPSIALTSGSSGLDALTLIVNQSKSFLVEDGWLLLEHGYDQRDSCRHLLSTAGFTSLFDESDLGGNPRVSGGKIRIDK